ncbi:hypothetical protein DSL72_009049 [Monilinia vaccinii-corymbosi]|uniref:Uncharacterized protein n=1 Tax=Monilinia vaccinii-corymbosi TaxID=61207 RepID=A0A8A3PNG6_9HELO|nr:hypothetical protein DSL72_009049 [Monilinia vaccinii-corymbosi]
MAAGEREERAMERWIMSGGGVERGREVEVGENGDVDVEEGEGEVYDMESVLQDENLAAILKEYENEDENEDKEEQSSTTQPATQSSIEYSDDSLDSDHNDDLQAAAQLLAALEHAGADSQMRASEEIENEDVNEDEDEDEDKEYIQTIMRNLGKISRRGRRSEEEDS